jgi:hypothetical protein
MGKKIPQPSLIQRNKYMFNKVAIALIICINLGISALAEDQKVQTLSELSKADNWIIGAKDKNIKVNNIEDYLQIVFKSQQGNISRLMLKTPVKIPEWATDFTFEEISVGGTHAMYLDIIVKDATGKEFLYKTKTPFKNDYHGRIDLLNTGDRRLRGKLVRFTTPGLTQEKLTKPGFEKRGFIITEPPLKKPVKPLKIIGLHFEGVKGKEPKLFFKGFCFSNLNSKNSAFTYQFKDLEMFEELDGPPSIQIGELWVWGSKNAEYNISWNIRNQYEGKPFIAGGKIIKMVSPETVPYPIQLAQKIELPKLPAGTYWVRVKIKRSEPLKRYKLGWFDALSEYDYRLFVIKNKVTELTKKTYPAETPFPNSLIRIAPEKNSRIFSVNEKFAVPVYFYPSGKEEKINYKITVVTANLKTPKKTLSGACEFKDGKPFIADLDLTELIPGVYRIKAELFSNGEPLDMVERLVGKQGPTPVKKVISITSNKAIGTEAKNLLNQKRPRFHLSPMIHSQTAYMKDKNRWDFFKPFMEQANTVSTDMEYVFPWGIAEPLPGVYDWEEPDKVMDYASQMGLSILYWPGIRHSPEWLPSDFSKNQDGKIFFDFAYNFHGGRLNYWNSDEIKKYVLRYIKNCVLRYRNHPVLQGYFYAMELPGDAPFMGWIEGYSDKTISNFQNEMQKKYKDISIANQAWGTKFKKWDQLAPAEKGSSKKYWLDWLKFREVSIDNFFEDLVKETRKLDSQKLIALYCDFPKISFTYEKLKKYGCMIANGGAHNAIHPFAHSELGLAGIHERMEDHWPGVWTGYFPTVLESSIFAMSFVGGKGMHCKSYIFTYLQSQHRKNKATGDLKFDELRRHPYSLDRYEKLIPIMTELKNARRLPVEIRELMDIESFWVEKQNTYKGGYFDAYAQVTCYENHLNFGAGPINIADKGKIMLMIKNHLNYLTSSTIKKIVNFVHNGGTLILRADAGRYCIEKPDADWVLLKEFGFASPEKNSQSKAQAKAIMLGNKAQNSELFRLQNPWSIKPVSSTEILADFVSPLKTPAITARNFGKGRVIVIWGSSIIPPRFAGKDNFTFLRELCSIAGVKPAFNADTPFFWMNMLKNKQEETYYGLVLCGVIWENNPKEKISSKVYFQQIPAGTYEVTELISGKKLPSLTSEQLKNNGIELSLEPRGVVIYRFKKLE